MDLVAYLEDFCLVASRSQARQGLVCSVDDFKYRRPTRNLLPIRIF
jgi:hypothetical protein